MRSCSSLLFGKCGKFASKIISLILVFATIFCFSISAYAADGSENINTIDMNVSANVTIDTTPNVDGGVVTEDIEIQKSVVSGQLGFNGFIQYVFPTPTDVVNEKRLLAEVCLDDNFSIVSGHEYNLNFTWGYNINLSAYSCGLLRFYNNDGEIIKEQNLFVSNGIKPSTLCNVDISFIPDTKDLTSGYRCELVLIFVQGGNNSTSQAQRFYISPEIVLIDKDDDSGWFQKIINKINDVWESVKSIPDKIGNKINELKENISLVITDLKENLIDGIKNLFIPDEEYLSTKKEELKQFCIDHFGAVYQSLDFFIDFLKMLINISPTEPKITFPAIDIPLFDKTYHLTDEVVYSFSWVNDKSHFLYYFYNFYRGFVTVLLFLTFIDYCRNKYAEVFGGDNK